MTRALGHFAPKQSCSATSSCAASRKLIAIDGRSRRNATSNELRYWRLAPSHLHGLFFMAPRECFGGAMSSDCLNLVDYRDLGERQASLIGSKDHWPSSAAANLRWIAPPKCSDLVCDKDRVSARLSMALPGLPLIHRKHWAIGA